MDLGGVATDGRLSVAPRGGLAMSAHDTVPISELIAANNALELLKERIQERNEVIRRQSERIAQLMTTIGELRQRKDGDLT